MQKWDVLKSEYIFRNLYCNIRADNCLLSNGKIIGNYIVNEYPDWVNTVAVTTENEMVFVKQYRHGCGDFLLEIPGGAACGDENKETAILRELREETGYVPERAPILLGSYYTNPANATNQVHTFLITGAEKKHGQHLDDTEEIEIVTHPFEEVDAMIGRGEISQFFTVAAYYLAKNYLEQNSK